MSTLYQKIGGESTIDRLVDAFYRNVLADPNLKTFFENVSVEKLRRMQKAFFTLALGGPEPDIPISLYEAHRNRGITREHLSRFTEHLVKTLGEVGIPQNEAEKVYQRIATYSDEVLGETTVDG